MDREEALRKLQATTTFTFVGEKVLLRQARVLQAAAEIERQLTYATNAPSDRAAVAAYGHQLQSA